MFYIIFSFKPETRETFLPKNSKGIKIVRYKKLQIKNGQYLFNTKIIKKNINYIYVIFFSIILISSISTEYIQKMKYIMVRPGIFYECLNI